MEGRLTGKLRCADTWRKSRNDFFCLHYDRISKKLVEIESSNEPYVSKIRPLLQKDYWLSHALIKFLNYEYDLGIKIRNKKTENKSAIGKLKEMQSKLSEKMNCEEEEKDLF